MKSEPEDAALNKPRSVLDGVRYVPLRAVATGEPTLDILQHELVARRLLGAPSERYRHTVLSSENIDPGHGDAADNRKWALIDTRGWTI